METRLPDKDTPQSGVNPPVADVSFLHHTRCLPVRGRAFGHMHHFVAGRIDGSPDPGAYPGQKGGAISGAFLGLYGFDRLAVDIGLDLAPQLRTSATSAQANSPHWNAQLLKYGQSVFEAEGNALHNRAHDVGA